ncbi:hypothetical protein B0H13DRAFT_1593808, partial [Mycena leptocephala]
MRHAARPRLGPCCGHCQVRRRRHRELSDLKIPARISQARVGLRRDLSMVREFARNVE